MKLRSALAFAFLLATPALGFAEPTAAGLWEAQDDSGKPEGWFLFTQKNEVYSARLVKGFKKEGDDTPVQNICTQCPGNKKGAHIMGLTLFYGMKRDGLNYSDGSVIDPRDGSVYHAKMWIDEDGQTLHVRGYLGISILGKTQEWKRLPDSSMKKEEIPKEILANSDTGEKKAKKPKGEKVKAKTEEAADPAATPVGDPADKAQ